MSAESSQRTELLVVFSIYTRFVRADNELDILVLGVLLDIMKFELPKE